MTARLAVHDSSIRCEILADLNLEETQIIYYFVYFLWVEYFREQTINDIIASIEIY